MIAQSTVASFQDVQWKPVVFDVFLALTTSVMAHDRSSVGGESVFSVLLDDLVDPVDVLGDAGVDSGVLFLGAPNPKGDYADLLARRVAVEEGAAAVSLHCDRKWSGSTGGRL